MFRKQNRGMQRVRAFMLERGIIIVDIQTEETYNE